MKLFEVAGNTIVISFSDPAGAGEYYSYVVGDRNMIREMFMRELANHPDNQKFKNAIKLLQKDDWKGFAKLDILSQGAGDELTIANGPVFIDGDHGDVEKLSDEIKHMFSRDDDGDEY